MPQQQGAGVVQVGGPGSTLRGPLYMRGGNGDKGQYSLYKLFDEFGVLSGAALGMVSVTVTSAQLKALHTTPLQIIAPAGAGTFIEIPEIIAELKYGTATYTSGGAISITYGSGGPALATVIPAALVTAAQNELFVTSESITAQQLASALINTGIFISAASADFATGDGTLMLRIRTRTHSNL